MARLIDAEKLIADIDEIRYECIGMRGGTVVLSAFARKYRDDIMQTIANQPTVDAVEVVHGEWLSAYEYALKIGVTDEERLEEAKKDKWWKFCNNCEQQVNGVRNYCPNCGADMRGKKNASD